MIRFEKTDKNAQIPRRSTEGAAGYDLHATEPAVIRNRYVAKIPTGITVEMAPGWAGFIEPRSGFALHHGVIVLGGVIDRDYYPNEIHVLLSSVMVGTELYIDAGDRIAQIIFRPVFEGGVTTGEQRTGGFGSTGHV